MSPDRRLITFGIGPGLLLGAIVLPMALYWGDLPDPMAVHWSLSGTPDGSLPPMVLLVGMAGVYAAAWWSVLQMVMRSPAEAASFSAGLYAIGGLLAGIQWFAVLASRKAETWQAAESVGWFELVIVLGDAAVLGVVGWLLAGGRRARSDRPVVEPTRLDVEHADQVVWSSRARNRILVLCGLALIVSGFTVWGWPTAVLALIGLVVLTFAEVRLTVGSRSAVIGLGWFGFPSWTVSMEDVTAGSTEHVLPLAYGGWGYRIRPGVRAIIVRRGEAVRLDRAAKPDLIVTVDDAETGAALVNTVVGASSDGAP
jgi:hypothetical protein